jgi:Domain of unknown function (DUF4386)
MQSRATVVIGGASLVAGALAFVGVFSYLAANFDYPGILDGSAQEVLPRLRGGGSAMRSVWAVYAFLPLLLVPGSVGAYFACPSSRGRMTVALVATCLGAFAMCLGLIRWPTIHWTLAEAYATATPDTRASLGAVFAGLNLYLGNYIGEFLGEACLGIFFLLTGLSMLVEPKFRRWLGVAGAVFAVLFLLGALRNVAPIVQPLADLNNTLLPIWMATLGVSLVWSHRRGGQQ